MLAWMLRFFSRRLSHVVACVAWQMLFRVGDGRRVSRSHIGFIDGLVAHSPSHSAGRTATMPRRSRSLDVPPTSGIVLKAASVLPNGRLERGVIVLRNNERIENIRRLVAVDALQRDYFVVLEPSWGGYAGTGIIEWYRPSGPPLVVMSPAEADHRLIERLGGNLVPVRLGSGDWADPHRFRPLGRSVRCFDAIACARLHIHKRLHLLLDAVARIGDPAYRLIILASLGGDAGDTRGIRALILRRGLSAQVSIGTVESPEEVNDMLNDSKVNVLLSLREGANRSIAEGLLSGTPCLVSAGHRSIRPDMVNPETGRFVADHELVDALRFFRTHWSDYAPRAWAMKNVTPAVSTALLNERLRSLEVNAGRPWTKDIVVKCNAPEVQYWPRDSVHESLPTLTDVLARYAVNAVGNVPA